MILTDGARADSVPNLEIETGEVFGAGRGDEQPLVIGSLKSNLGHLEAAAGIAGVAVMTVAEKAEQLLTKRPNSYVPAHTLSHVLGLDRPDDDRWGRNMAMHYGNGILLGALRGVMAAANLRGVQAALMLTPVRLTWDQTLENVTGVGAPPWTWPRDELVIEPSFSANPAHGRR